MNAIQVSAAIGLSIALGGASLGARAQEAAPTLAGLAVQVKAMADQLRQANALAARQQQAIGELSASNAALASKLGCVLKFSSPHDFVVDGCNLHVRNGAGRTDTTNRYGNLIIGYNRNEQATRTGSHNLVLGDLNEYRSYSGIVSGVQNTLGGPNATILGGGLNSANASGAAIVGASTATADGNVAIVGGLRGYGSPEAHFGVVIGGNEDSVTAPQAVVVAGTFNEASGFNALACGGNENVASGGSSTACGGSQNRGSGNNSFVAGGAMNAAPGLDSTVTGGTQNAAQGLTSTVTGGHNCATNAAETDKWAVGFMAAPGGCSAFAN